MLPNHEIPVALLSFNLGVELGQIAFIGAVIAFRHVARRRMPNAASPAYWASTYAVGGLASFWTIQRIATF